MALPAHKPLCRVNLASIFKPLTPEQAYSWACVRARMYGEPEPMPLFDPRDMEHALR